MSYEDTKRKLLEDAASEFESSKRDYDDALDDLEKVLDSSEATSKSANSSETPVSSVTRDELPSSDSKPAETISSQGYDPSKKPNDGTSYGANNGEAIPATANADQYSNNDHANGLPRQDGVGEQAPDVDKDYGSGGDGIDGSNEEPPIQNTGEEKREEPEEQKKKKEKKKKEDEEDKKKGEEKDPKEDPTKKKPDGEEGKDEENKDDPTKKKPVTGQEGAQPSGEGEQSPKQNGGQPGQNPQQKGNGEATQGNKSDNGNGYGALNKNKPQGMDHSDPTARARRNLAHNNASKSESGSKPTAKSSGKGSSSGGKGGGSTPKSKGSGIAGGVKNAFSKAANGLKNTAKKLTNGGGLNKSPKGSEKFLGALKNATLSFVKRHPILSAALAIFVVFFFIMAMEEVSGGKGGTGRGKRSCTYELSGVTSTGTVELSNLKVEVINCDGTAENYEVLETVDFEKYILGVALAEAGPSSPDEALKAQIIAVRNFTLTRNSGMCPGNPSDCFYGYNESSGIIRMRACTNDQVYWDYTKDCSKVERSGKPTLYCVGVDGSTDIWKKALGEDRKKELESLANDVMGEVLLDENGNVLKLGYQKDETDQFIAMANEGKSYVEILESVYGSKKYSSADCAYGGVYDYNDYSLSSENTGILREPLDEFLEDNGSSLEEFNELIAENVDDAGWGTRAGVVAAAVTLIGELGNNYGVKVPYYWSGGHYDGVVDGALGYWGSTECHTYANNQHYNYCGLDCSGFVPWAIKNGGFKKGVDLAGNFENMPGARRVKLTTEPQLQPGDLLESDSHIVLVVGIDEASGQYICAEAMGNAYGVLFSRRAFNEKGYWGVDLEDYYNNPSNIREPIRWKK